MNKYNISDQLIVEVFVTHQYRLILEIEHKDIWQYIMRNYQINKFKKYKTLVKVIRKAKKFIYFVWSLSLILLFYYLKQFFCLMSGNRDSSRKPSKI